jgi:hypothetical protein
MPEDNLLTTDDYSLLCHGTFEALQRAKEQDFVPPYELRVTGPDDDLIAHCELWDDFRFKIIGPDMKLNIRWPVTVTVTDVNGETLLVEMTPSPLVRQ